MYLNKEADLVYLDEFAPSLIISPRYATCENLVGTPLDGYEAPRVAIKKPVAEALLKVDNYLETQGYKLAIYDGYRPTRAVRRFISWQKSPSENLVQKMKYYPTISKRDLFKLGYLSLDSVHCKGYAVDLTLIKVGDKLREPALRERILTDGRKISLMDDGTVDMGTSFDFMSEASRVDSPLLGEKCLENRNILKNAMLTHRFAPYPTEWWHYNYLDQTTFCSYDLPISSR
ncbi:MAG: hypothetical protein LBL99_02510 [Holosporaceae bacterium]|jgi:D-alanyl-D-alanine dipeptidase|nr:hypothetical protein [Holosporaceae bacterium]